MILKILTKFIKGNQKIPPLSEQFSNNHPHIVPQKHFSILPLYNAAGETKSLFVLVYSAAGEKIFAIYRVYSRDLHRFLERRRRFFLEHFVIETNKNLKI